MRGGVGARAAWLGALLLPLCALAQQSEESQPRDWLTRMAEALRTQNYEGTFVYFHDNKLEAMQVVHQADERGERERLFALSGAPREILRDNDVVKCILPDDRSVLVEKRAGRSTPFPTNIPAESETLEAQYELLDLGSGRVAGRECKIIGIKPRDGFRYGYRLWLDEVTALPLKSELLAESGEVVEQVMFTEIRPAKVIPEAALRQQVSAEGYKWHVRDPKPETLSTPLPFWEARILPPGFKLANDRRRQGRNGPVRHLIYSDGLASVSVFAEPWNADRESLQGLSRMGAVSAFGRQMSGYQLTVVGEVPPATVSMIAESLALQPRAELP